MTHPNKPSAQDAANALNDWQRQKSVPHPTHTDNGEREMLGMPSTIEMMIQIKKYWTVSGSPELKEFAEYTIQLIKSRDKAQRQALDLQGQIKVWRELRKGDGLC